MREQRTLSRAVVEQRAPGIVEKDDPVTQLFRKLDYFPTPPWAARAIAHRIKQLDPGALTAADPCCGEGHFAEPLKEIFGPGHVLASDIYDFGYGEVEDFLTLPSLYARNTIDWFITNVPFAPAADFIAQMLRLAVRGCCVLCRTAFLESEGRERMLYESANPLTRILPFVERVPMQLGSWDPEGSSATSYSAFVFHKGHKPEPHMPFLSGTRQRFWRDDDPARFAKPAPIPLFENMAPAPLFR